MAEIPDCYGLDVFSKMLEDASGDAGKTSPQITKTTTKTNKAIQGKKTYDALMDPIRQLKKEEQTATGMKKQTLKDKIASHYSDAAEKNATPEKIKITNDMIADSDVKAYIHEMSIDEFAETRMELQTTFGGAQARIMEIEFKDTKLKSLGTELEALGRNTHAVKQEISTMGARGILSDKDLDTLRALEELKTFDDSIIAPGTSRKTYTSLRSKLGEPITNEIFANKIEKNISDIKTNLDKLNKQERIGLEDIITGRRPLDANAFEFTSKALQKIDQSTFAKLRTAIKPLDELDGPAKTAIYGELGKKNKIVSVITTGKNIVYGTIGIATFGLGILYGIPQTMVWIGTSTVTNNAEMVTLYEQFKDGVGDIDQLQEALLNEEQLQAINDFLSTWKTENIYNRPPLSWMMKIPYYNDYLREYIDPAMESTWTSVTKNIKRQFVGYKNMGLVVEGDSKLGYELANKEQILQYYTNNEDALMAIKDQKWLREYGTKLYGDTAFEAGTTPDGEPMSATETMIYYHKLKNDGIAPPYGSDLGVSDRVDAWGGAKDQSEFANKVRAYGDAKEKELTSKKTTPIAPTAQGTSSQLVQYTATELAYWNKIGLDKEQIKTREERGDTLTPDGKGGFTINIGGNTISTEQSTTFGGEGSSVSGGESTTSNTTTSTTLPNDKKSQYANKLLSEKGYQKSSPAEKDAQLAANTRDDGTVDINSMKTKDKDLKLTALKGKVTSNDVETYVKENVNTMIKNKDKKSMDEAVSVDKKAVANAILAKNRAAGEAECGGA